MNKQLVVILSPAPLKDFVVKHIIDKHKDEKIRIHGPTVIIETEKLKYKFVNDVYQLHGVGNFNVIKVHGWMRYKKAHEVEEINHIVTARSNMVEYLEL